MMQIKVPTVKNIKILKIEHKKKVEKIAASNPTRAYIHRI